MKKMSDTPGLDQTIVLSIGPILIYIFAYVLAKIYFWFSVYQWS